MARWHDSYHRNMRVEVRSDEDGAWLPGFVRRKTVSGHVIVHIDGYSSDLAVKKNDVRPAAAKAPASTKRAPGAEPWVSNYPALKAWLDSIDARCDLQLPVGDPKEPRAYLERWLTRGGRAFIIEVRANKHGWELYTAPPTAAIDETLLDANRRLDVKGKVPT